jgi:hypothetical protein
VVQVKCRLQNEEAWKVQVLLLCESLEYIHEEHMALRPSASVATMLPGLRLIFNIVVLLDDVHLIIV